MPARRLRPLFFALLLLCAWHVRAASQDPGGEITVDVTGALSAPAESYLNGYRGAVDGQVILYHSSHPDAEAALIVRANSAAHAAAWRTDTVPAHGPDEHVRFIWLAGLERAGWGESKNGHRFDLLINGERWFTFRNYKDSTAPRWSVRGKDGAELSFTARMADKFGDQFGYMVLRLPGKYAEAGKPLTLQVVGEQADSPEWYMAFQYSFTFTPQVRVEPALFRGSDGETQVLRLSLDNLREGKTIEILTSEGATRRESLMVGANIYTLPIRAVERLTVRTLRFRVNGEEIARASVRVTPVARREIYLLSHSHNDIGYTELQTAVEQKQWRNIDEALRLIGQTRGYPPDAQFRWNIEVLWPLESYLRNAAPERREALLGAIRSGHVGLNALYANILTGLATAPEMSHFTEYARAFSAEHEIPITTALVSDIPGFTWGIVPALAQSGVKYFASGPNSGDRIGYVLEAMGDKPFYWSSRSGKEKVLFWVAGAGYSTFHEGTLAKLGDEKLMKLLRRLDQSGYPYDMVHLPYTQGDNGPPDSTLPEYVRRWNETYSSPRLVIATHKEMFEEFEKRYGGMLRTRVGDFTPYWEDGAISTAAETALNRRAVDRLVSGEAIWSMRSPAGFPREEYAAAWRNVVLYDEHTWGADKSVSDPDDPGVRGQWRIKRQFALDADSLSRLLLARALGETGKGKSGAGAIDVHNPTGWERSDLVLIPAALSRAGDRVLDEAKRPLPSQRLATGELAFLPGRLGPFSTTRFWVGKGTAPSGGLPRPSARVLENSRVRLSVNPETGAIEEFFWKERNVHLASAGRGLNQYLYVPGTNPDSALPLSRVAVRAGESGPVVRSMLIQGDAPGCRRYETELRLTEGSDRLEIATTIDKIAVREKEAIHVAFPFAVPNATVHYDVAGAMVEPEIDQLPGSCKNFFSVQSWVDVSNAEYGVTLATPDAPLIEIGAITAERPWRKTAETSATIYSYVMNNYWHTNYKADQEGVMVLRYVLQPHGPAGPLEAPKFGIECRQGLIVAPAGAGAPAEPLFRVGSDRIVVESVKPLSGGGWLVYAYNPYSAPAGQALELCWRGGRPVTLTPSDPSGRAIAPPIAGPLVIPAGGSLYVKAEAAKK